MGFDWSTVSPAVGAFLTSRPGWMPPSFPTSPPPRFPPPPPRPRLHPRKRPAIRLPPLVGTHDKDAYRRFRRAGVAALEMPIHPAQHRCVVVQCRSGAEVALAGFAALH